MVHTGQHYDTEMSQVFFEEMGIPEPKYNLSIGGGKHGEMTGRMLESIERVLIEEQPGLRSHNMKMPEEINRILTDRISDFLFCTSEKPVANLNKEGVQHWNAKVIISGDIMKDAVNLYEKKTAPPKGIVLTNGGYCLATVHRAENTDDPIRLKAIFSALRSIAEKETVVLPLHPRTEGKIREYDINTGSIVLIDPVGYFNMLWMLKNCCMVITDSGGLQKEAYYFEQPCIILRDETEWEELVANNYSVLVGANTEMILDGRHAFSFNDDYSTKYYGTGNACEIIIEELTGIKKDECSGGAKYTCFPKSL